MTLYGPSNTVAGSGLSTHLRVLRTVSLKLTMMNENNVERSTELGAARAQAQLTEITFWLENGGIEQPETDALPLQPPAE